MASFQKRGKTWQFVISRYVDGKSKPIRKGGFKTKTEAKIVADEIEDRLNKNNTLHLKDIPFAEYFERWLELTKSETAPTTKARYKNTLKTIKNYFKLKNIQDITRSDYQEFINEYAKDKHKTTVKKINGHIRACVLDAIEDGYIMNNFTRKVTLGGKERDVHKEAVLSYDELNKLKKYIVLKLEQNILENELMGKSLDLRYLAIYISINTGLRFGEIVGLTTKDINTEHQLIDIHKTWGYKKTTKRGFGKTKNRETRIIKIGKSSIDLLERIIPLLKSNEKNLLFYVEKAKYNVINNSGTNKLLKRLLLELDIKKDLTFHSLRHTHASVLLYKKVSIQYVSERLGHSDIVTTYKYYSHVLQELRIEDENKSIEIFE